MRVQQVLGRYKPKAPSVDEHDPRILRRFGCGKVCKTNLPDFEETNEDFSKEFQLIATGIPLQCNAKCVYGTYEKHGTIKQIKLIVGTVSLTRNTQHAVITFDTPGQVKAALAGNTREINHEGGFSTMVHSRFWEDGKDKKGQHSEEKPGTSKSKQTKGNNENRTDKNGLKSGGSGQWKLIPLDLTGCSSSKAHSTTLWGCSKQVGKSTNVDAKTFSKKDNGRKSSDLAVGKHQEAPSSSKLVVGKNQLKITSDKNKVSKDMCEHMGASQNTAMSVDKSIDEILEGHGALEGDQCYDGMCRSIEREMEKSSAKAVSTDSKESSPADDFVDFFRSQTFSLSNGPEMSFEKELFRQSRFKRENTANEEAAKQVNPKTTSDGITKVDTSDIVTIDLTLDETTPTNNQENINIELSNSENNSMASPKNMLGHDKSTASMEKMFGDDKSSATMEKMFGDDKSSATMEKMFDGDKSAASTENMLGHDKSTASMEKLLGEVKSAASTENMLGEEKSIASMEKMIGDDKSAASTEKLLGKKHIRKAKREVKKPLLGEDVIDSNPENHRKRCQEFVKPIEVDTRALPEEPPFEEEKNSVTGTREPKSSTEKNHAYKPENESSANALGWESPNWSGESVENNKNCLPQSMWRNEEKCLVKRKERKEKVNEKKAYWGQGLERGQSKRRDNEEKDHHRKHMNRKRECDQKDFFERQSCNKRARTSFGKRRRWDNSNGSDKEQHYGNRAKLNHCEKIKNGWVSNGTGRKNRCRNRDEKNINRNGNWDMASERKSNMDNNEKGRWDRNQTNSRIEKRKLNHIQQRDNNKDKRKKEQRVDRKDSWIVGWNSERQKQEHSRNKNAGSWRGRDFDSFRKIRDSGTGHERRINRENHLTRGGNRHKRFSRGNEETGTEPRFQGRARREAEQRGVKLHIPRIYTEKTMLNGQYCTVVTDSDHIALSIRELLDNCAGLF